MKEVVYDKKWLKSAPNTELYYMYRGVKEKNSLRYDLTVIPSMMLGEEFVKTKGHKHSRSYQELYIVLEGKAIYLMQRGKNEKIEDVFAVKAKRGNVVIIPANYGHITINPSPQTLKMTNWINKKCRSVYDLFEKMEGACYYYTKAGWIKNKNYTKIPKLRFEKPFKSMPKSLDFLK